MSVLFCLHKDLLVLCIQLLLLMCVFFLRCYCFSSRFSALLTQLRPFMKHVRQTDGLEN